MCGNMDQSHLRECRRVEDSWYIGLANVVARFPRAIAAFRVCSLGGYGRGRALHHGCTFNHYIYSH